MVLLKVEESRDKLHGHPGRERIIVRQGKAPWRFERAEDMFGSENQAYPVDLCC